MKIVCKRFEGKELSCVAKNYMAIADRVAFEHRFLTSPAQMAAWAEWFEEDEFGNARIKEGADVSSMREEWQVFFCWRELRRQRPDVPEDFDEFCNQLADLQILGAKPKKAEEKVDPTAAAARPT